jgi:heme-degrading monooxygenase HmoA
MNDNGVAKRPAIARIWRGRVRAERADEYEAYNYEAGIKPLMEKAMGVQTFREDRGGESEFITISYWESVEAMSVFAGSDPTRIHHLDSRPGVFDRAAQGSADRAVAGQLWECRGSGMRRYWRVVVVVLCYINPCMTAACSTAPIEWASF